MRGDYTKCESYVVAKSNGGTTNVLKPTPPLSRLCREGKIGHTCPHCNSTTAYYGKLFGIFKPSLFAVLDMGIFYKYISTDVKKYCINDRCMYNYFEILKDSKKLTNSDILSMPIVRTRDEKLKKLGIS